MHVQAEPGEDGGKFEGNYMSYTAKSLMVEGKKGPLLLWSGGCFVFPIGFKFVSMVIAFRRLNGCPFGMEILSE